MFTDEMESRFKGHEKGRIKAAVEILKEMKVHTTGGPLAILAGLDNLNKHEALILCACRLRTAYPKPPDGTIHHVGFLDPLEEGTILAFPMNAFGEVNMEYDLAFEIAFAETKITQGEAVLPTLHRCTSTANNIVEAFLAAGLLT
jgi:hypothetical protein